jgi:hypothetical protein
MTRREFQALKRRQDSQREREQASADQFNAKHAIGTKVRVFPLDRGGPSIETRTRTAAEVLSGHTAVVWVEGRPGCYALTHVDVIEEAIG